MTEDAALFAGALTYGFRARQPREDAAAYRKALIEHVRVRDFSAAYEIQLNKPLADWSADEVLAFRQYLSSQPPPSETPRPGLTFPMATDASRYPVTEASLVTLADQGLASLVRMRERKPRKQLAIFISVLLTDGALITVVPPTRADRVSILKLLAQTHPVFGFFIAFDAFSHTIDEATGTATKKDALMLHIGTREMRVLKLRPYVVRGPLAIFETPPPPPVDLRHLEHGQGMHDPYAGIFVSVPPSEGVS